MAGIGGDGGIGGPAGSVGDMGSAGYGGGYGNAVGLPGPPGTPGFGTASGVGAAQGGIAGGSAGGFGGMSYGGQYGSMGPLGGLGTAYPGGGGGGGGGSGSGGASNNFYYPTPAEVYNSAYTLPHTQAQTGILGNMSDWNAFRSAVLPEIQGVMKTLGRSGMPSSSYADRIITDSLASLYNKWQWNVLTGWQNLGAQMPQMMNQWYQPYNSMLGYVAT